MTDGPMISRVAALIGDPARANILIAMMDGRALTVTELAQVAGVTIQTASGHLAKLSEARMTLTEKQGRHRYVRLSGPDIAQLLEGLMSVAQRTGATPVRTGPNDVALRTARMCYDHLAGERGLSSGRDARGPARCGTGLRGSRLSFWLRAFAGGPGADRPVLASASLGSLFSVE